jgi:hypothetical protein
MIWESALGANRANVTLFSTIFFGLSDILILAREESYIFVRGKVAGD